MFERACARDTAGLETAAEPFYRAALAATPGLDPYRRTRAVIQLASTLRWLGRLDESEQLLVSHLDAHRDEALDHPLHDEARAILALTYAEQGRGKEATGLALAALAPRLNHIQRQAGFCNLGYWVRQSREGQGAASSVVRELARFGFEQLRLNRIEIVVAVGNEASLRVARKCGAVEEGVLRNRVVMGGQPMPAHMLSLIPG